MGVQGFPKFYSDALVEGAGAEPNHSGSTPLRGWQGQGPDAEYVGGPAAEYAGGPGAQYVGVFSPAPG